MTPEAIEQSMDNLALSLTPDINRVIRPIVANDNNLYDFLILED